MKKLAIICIILLIISGLVYWSVMPHNPKKPAGTVIRETVINEVAIEESVETVVNNFGQAYIEEDRVLDLGAGPVTYLAFVYTDAVIYTADRLVKVIELTTPSYPSPRGVKVGDPRETVERVYWLPEGFSGTEEKYTYEFNTSLVFTFRNNIVTKIELLP